MRAGLLTDIVVFSHLTTVTSESGATKKVYVDYLTTKACKRKLSAAVGIGINASEQFIANTLVIQVRNNPAIKETDRAKCYGRTYSITLIDPQKDNSLFITLSKVNT